MIDRNSARVGFIFVLALLIHGCDKSKNDWISAKQLNTIEGYNQFMSKHPESKFFETARQRIEELVWDSISKDNTIKAYKRFLTEYPESKFVDTAKEKIEQITRLEELEEKSNVRIVPFKNGYCSIEGPISFFIKAEAVFEGGPVVEYEGETFQIVKPVTENAYIVPSISVQFLTQTIQPSEPARKLECNNQKWNNDQQTVDFFYSDDTVQIILHIYHPFMGGMVIKGIECLPSD